MLTAEACFASKKTLQQSQSPEYRLPWQRQAPTQFMHEQLLAKHFGLLDTWHTHPLLETNGWFREGTVCLRWLRKNKRKLTDFTPWSRKKECISTITSDNDSGRSLIKIMKRSGGTSCVRCRSEADNLLFISTTWGCEVHFDQLQTAVV